MRVLAVDTTAEFGSIAVAENGVVLDETPLHSPAGFSPVLFGHVERSLKRFSWSVSSIDCFAAAAGPGSFTGVRVGLSAVKGLAEATGRSAAAVSNLEALAWYGSAPLRAALIDARRGEVYGAVYDSEGRAVRPEIVAGLDVWLESLAGLENLEILTPDAAPFRSALAGRKVTERRSLAAAVAQIAGGRCGAPAGIDANYVRRSDAELFWKE